MQALVDLRQLRADLVTAYLSKLRMNDRSLGQHRRDLANVAFSRALERLFDGLIKLETQPMAGLPESKPALILFEQMLSTIAEGEAKLRRMA